MLRFYSIEYGAGPDALRVPRKHRGGVESRRATCCARNMGFGGRDVVLAVIGSDGHLAAPLKS